MTFSSEPIDDKLLIAGSIVFLMLDKVADVPRIVKHFWAYEIFCESISRLMNSILAEALRNVREVNN